MNSQFSFLNGVNFTQFRVNFTQSLLHFTVGRNTSAVL
jgi:hypothetical protein